ncbi:MAG: hypothetical protein GKR90_20615 [Pseudomonadales bacterium]|nr:hypothetical protein [Pseudomonadales bacterium]
MLDRLTLIGALIIVAFISVLLLPSQSAASYSTYLLLVVVLATFQYWNDIKSVTLFKWILVLVIWLTASSLWSEPFEWREFGSILVRALLVLAFVVALAECQFRGQLHNWMSTAFAIVGSAVITASITNFYLEQPADGRLNGLGQLDTHVVAALVYGSLLLFAVNVLFTDAHRALVGLCICSILVTIPTIYLSDSRNAWFSVPISCFVLCLLHLVDRQRFLICLAATVVIGVSILCVVLLNPELEKLVLPRGDSFRLAIWQAALSNIATSPWVGLGILSPDDLLIDQVIYAHPHNMYLSIIHQGGLVALGLYLIVLVQSVKVLLRNLGSPDAKLALSILALALLAHLFDEHELIDKIGSTWFLIWIPLSTAVGLAWREQPKKEGMP